MKTLEEMAELNEKLLKFLNKQPQYKPKTEDIVEEIGDVYVRLAVIAQHFGLVNVQQRIDEKSQSLMGHVTRREYKGGL